MKTYQIDSFEQLANVVNTENAERLAIDLAIALRFYAGAMQQIREAHPEATKGMTNDQISSFGFKWKDDGKHELTAAIIIAKETGEENTIQFQKP